MSVSVHREVGFGNSAIETNLIHIFGLLQARSEEALIKQHKRNKVIANVALSAVAVISALCGYETAKFFEREDEKDETLIGFDKISAFFAGGLGFWAFEDRIKNHLQKGEDDRRRFKDDTVYGKIRFSEPFDQQTNARIADLTGACPITYCYPRFPVRDTRVLSNGQINGQIYDWSALKMVMALPPNLRTYVPLKSARFEDFEFCEDLCIRTHRVLYEMGRVSSENPIESLTDELRNLGDLPPPNVDGDPQ